MNFFYDELNKQAQINAVLDDNENPETQEAVIGTFQNPEELIGNIGNDYYEDPDLSEFIYGKLNKEIEVVGSDYIGLDTESASVKVDNKASTIEVNVNTDFIATKELVLALNEQERNFRAAEDEALRTKIDQDIATLNENLSSRVDALDTELKSVEEELNKLVDLEIDKIEELIQNEADTRESNDNTLQEHIDDLNEVVQQEIVDRADLTTRLRNDLNTEIAQRIEADTAFQNDLDSETQRRETEHTAITKRIDDEIKARSDADNALSLRIEQTNQNLAQEAIDRGNADKTLQSNIDSEKSAREQAISNLDDKKLDKANANRNVLTEAEFTYNGDNVYSKHDYINLVTLEEDTQEHLFKLATDTTAGLMATADYKSIRDLQSRVQNLEAKTTRLLYTDKTNPTAAEINAFVIGEGYTSPFEGIAVVVAGTYHIWHFYEGGVGWKDDGADTVTNFTNTTSGTILGSATDGKVYAETEGTGSVYGWGDLKARVTNNETNLKNTNSRLDAEIKRSTETDTAHNTSIQDLQSQITSNDEDIASLENTKATKEALNTAISTLTTNINNVNTELSQQLQTEAATRENADNKLTETIEGIWSSTDTSGSAQTAIAEEQRARIAEDNRIVNLLTAETNARTEADTTLQNNINTLTENLNKEEDARVDADNQLQSNIDTLTQNLNQEIEDREETESQLQENIDKKLDKIDNSTTYTQAYTVTADDTQSSMIITSEVAGTTLVQRDTAGRFKVAAPTQESQATNKKYVDDLVATEKSNRETSDSGLQEQINKLNQDLSTETTNRTNADTTLQENIDKKLDKLTGEDTSTTYVYSTLNGENALTPVKETSDSSTIVIRKATGTIALKTGTQDDEATTKKYVDDADNVLQGSINTLNTNIDRNVVTTTGFTYNGDDVVSTHTLTNLKTGLETQESHTFNLANQTTAGLMSSEDVKTLSDLQARVGNLESKTTRLWYSGVENPTTNDINTFVTNLGYTSPFEGIAVVVEMSNGSHHIWHYYEGNIGWRDDGVDTVSLFTSENPGIVLGSTGTAGKIFAESDGTASVIGWDDLTNQVDDNKQNIINLQKDSETHAKQSALTEEISRAKGVEQSLQEQITQESATREENDNALGERITQLNTALGTTNTNLGTTNTNLSNEITRATAAEQQLQTNINSEATTRAQEDAKKVDIITGEGLYEQKSNNTRELRTIGKDAPTEDYVVTWSAGGTLKAANPVANNDVVTKSYMEANAGKIDTISVNNVNIPADSNKNVNITIDYPVTDVKFKDASIVTNKVAVLPNDLVQDANYVHTDNNFTTDEKTKLAGLENYNDTEIKEDIKDLQDNKADTTLLDNYLPLTAGADKPLTGILYTKYDSSIWSGTSGIQLAPDAYITGSTNGQVGIKSNDSIRFRIGNQNDAVIEENLLRPGVNKTVNLGNVTYQWNDIYGTTIYQSGKQVANKEDLVGLATEEYVNENGGKIDTISINSTALDIVNKNVDIPLGSDSVFGVLKVGTGLTATNGVVSLNTSGLITDNNLSTKVESVVGTQSTLTTTAKTLVGAVNELDSELTTLSGDLSNLSNKVDNIDALKILNKDVVEATEDTVQTVATNYVQTEYSRTPNNNDGLIITLTDKENEKILYVYSSYSSKWISAGSESVDISEGSYTEKGIVSVAQNAGIKVDLGVLSLDSTYLSNNYLTISTDQTVSGKKLFVNAQQKVADSDYRSVLTTPLTTVNTKQYLLGQTNSTGDLITNTNESVYMEAGKLFSNGSEVLNLLDNQTITGVKTFNNNIKLTGGFGLNFTDQDSIISSTTKTFRFGSSTNDNSSVAVLADKDETVAYFRPGVNKKFTLGSTGYMWKDLYLSGNLSDGTNNITVAELVELKTTGGSGGDGLITIRRWS